VTIATDSGGRQGTRTDGLPQATRAAALAGGAGTWLRDEEANANMSSVEETSRPCRGLPVSRACGDLVPATANTRNEQRTLPACIDPYRSASDRSGPIGADEALWLALCLAPDEGTDVSELLHLTGMSHPTL
jgi:hypothetical protein